MVNLQNKASTPQNGSVSNSTSNIASRVAFSRTPYAFFLVLIIFLLSLAISSLTPSFQSPDEDLHLKRAYLLGHGQIWLSAPPGKPTGGLVDQGLLSYMEKFHHLPFHGEQKITANDLYEAKQIQWAKVNTFSATEGQSYYFPLIYLPQAIGIRIGEILDIPVDLSYQLAKLSALIAACALLYWALTLYSFSALTLGLFILPMSLFQMGSASLDGIAHAICFVVLALYLRISQMKSFPSKWIALTLCILIALLTTSRMHLIPLLFLPFLAYRNTQQKFYLWGGVTALTFTVAWIIMTMLFVVDLRVVSTLKGAGLIAYYAMHPLELFQVFLNTFTSVSTLKSYATAFIGVLGWLDTSFPKFIYIVFSALLGLITLSCISWRPRTIKPSVQATFVICALGSIAVIFLSLLVQWTPHPATIILGVQGRYFFGPALLLSIAFTSPINIEKSIRQFLSSTILIALASCSLVFTSNLLLQRYYLMPEQQVSGVLIQGLSKPLSAKESIPIVFSSYQTKTPAKLQGISIYIDAPTAACKAQLQLSTSDGSQQLTTFEYRPDMQSGYIPLSIPGNTYTAGKLIAVEGEGLKIKTVESSDGVQRACIIYELSDGSRRYTPGCP
jgi:uncharacterized membrane protein